MMRAGWDRLAIARAGSEVNLKEALAPDRAPRA